MAGPSECGIEPPGSISHGVIYNKLIYISCAGGLCYTVISLIQLYKIRFLRVKDIARQNPCVIS